MLEWQLVETSDDSRHDELIGGITSLVARAKIPGGWLVKLQHGDAIASTFVPDPQHKWNGKSLF